MGIALDIVLPVLLLGLVGYSRNNKEFSESQKNGITVVLMLILVLFFAIRIWP